MPSVETNTYLSWTIPLTAILSACAAVLGYKYAMMPRAPSEMGIPSVGTLITDVLTFIPHILLLFGVLADMLTYRGVYSIASLVGLLSIPMNFAFKFFWTGIIDIFGKIVEVISYRPTNVVGSNAGPIVQMGGAIREYDGCNVQGFGGLASPYAPQSLVVTATVFSYYMFDLIGNRGWTAATATIVMFAVLYGAETMIIGACNQGVLDTTSALMKSTMALAEGLFVGGVSYATVQAYFPERLPSTVWGIPGSISASSLKTGPDGKKYDEAGQLYITLPDGSAVPAGVASGATAASTRDVVSLFSSGSPAQPASCTN